MLRSIELLERIAAGRHTVRTLDLGTGVVTLAEGDGTDVLDCNEARLITAFGPRWRLLVIGAGQLTHYVAQMALALDYAVTICDPREEYADGWLVPGTQLVRTMPDDTVVEFRPDKHTAIVALTHDPKLDDLALMEALKSDAFYVGAIGSQKNQAKRKERLQEFGVSVGTARAAARPGRAEEWRSHAAGDRRVDPRRDDRNQVRIQSPDAGGTGPARRRFGGVRVLSERPSHGWRRPYSIDTAQGFTSDLAIDLSLASSATLCAYPPLMASLRSCTCVSSRYIRA